MSNPNEDSLFFFDHPLVPGMAPVLGSRKLWEQDSDYSYLRYLYPMITHDILGCIEDRSDALEYEGSPMFDDYPDREYFRRIAREIFEQCKKKNPSQFTEDNLLLRDLIEVLLFHEILYRRNRYRNRKRLFL